MAFKRLIEARSIITHGLGENAREHEAYMAEFRQMVNQVERMYPLWLIDRGATPAATFTPDRSPGDPGYVAPGEPTIEQVLEEQSKHEAPGAPVVHVPEPA